MFYQRVQQTISTYLETKKRLVPQGHQPFRFYRLDYPFRCHGFALLLGRQQRKRFNLGIVVRD